MESLTAPGPSGLEGDPPLMTSLGPVRLANPIMPASGCFGPELASVIPLERLGALVTKTVFSGVRSGNPSHRLTESALGMLNAVGIPSLGKEGFVQHTLPGYEASGVPVVISIGGLSPAEYFAVVEELADVECAALEVNVSCPNLEHDGLQIGADPHQLTALVAGITTRTELPVIVKLTPNVSRIEDIARAAEDGGATALTIANTFLGLAVDAKKRRPVLGNTTGGVSGPAIKPMALRLVWQAAQVVTIPIIGCGGIVTAPDAVEFLMAGATAVQIGTATFTRPDAMIRIIDELPAALADVGATTAHEIVGTLSAA